MNDPEISVVLPVFNAEPYLERCIASLLAQDLPRERYELLFVDNGSTDRSRQILAAHEPIIGVLKETRRGAYAARNTALGVARGSVIAFTDPDCVVEPDWLTRACDALERPGVLAVVGRNDSVPGSESLAMLDAYGHYRDRWVFSRRDAAVYYAHTNNMAVRRAVIDRHAPFEERQRGGDVILIQRLLAHAGVDAVVYEPAMRVQHLEIASACDLFRKTCLYAQSRHSYGQSVVTRSPSRRELWSVYRDATREERLGPVRSAWLLGLLACGTLAGAFGALRARLVGSRIEQTTETAANRNEVFE